MTKNTVKAVVIGTSAGALGALTELLPKLPHGYPLPVMVVVHLPPDKESILAELLSVKCQVKVKEAEDKEFIQPGTVYFAPPDYHLLVEKDQSLSLSSEEPVMFSRPSIDVLFEAAADAYGPGLIGIILTGANNDGATGLKAVTEAGGVALVQNPHESYAADMPQAALRACAVAHALSLEQIAEYLQKAVGP